MSHNTSDADSRGVPISNANPEIMALFEKALWRFQSYFEDPIEPLDEALAIDPGFVLGHAFKATAMLLTTEAQYLDAARTSIEAAEAQGLAANDRERALTAAARRWLEGDWPAACRVWESTLIEHPRDALALQCAHLGDFLLGDATNLAGRLTRVMPAWNADVPGYSYILGMHAFGLEECNLYEQAEEAGRRAVQIEPRDPWAVHAVTHVMEMQGRFDEGIDWLESSQDKWAPDNGFAFHNWWHLALYYIEKRNYDQALAIYDTRIYPEPSDASMQLLDASAALWRLTLFGVDVGDRWRALAGDWSAKAANENGYYAFNDVHALMAYLGSGDQDSAMAVVEALERAATGDTRLASVNRMMSADVGLPVALALVAFNEARYDEAIETLFRVRSVANRFGGSHAQRDILTLTLIEAARRGGQDKLAAHVLNERLAARPLSPLARSLVH